MTRPLKVVDKFDASVPVQDKKISNVVPISPESGLLLEGPAVSAALPLGDFRFDADTRDNKLIDYLLIGVLSIVVHSAAVEIFKNMPLAREELIEPVKPPAKVQISFVQPKPKVVPPPPKQVVQPPPPPPPNVVPLKKPPKPKLKPKPVPRAVEPPPVLDTPRIVDAPAPVISAPPAPPPPPPKPKPVVEKVTQPSAGAAYLDNPEPVYPEIAEERGWDGKVLMKVHVLASGKPDSVAVVKSSGHDVLDSEAVRTVKKWSFVPAKRGTTPIDGWVTVPITFNLQN
ncbi:MAG: energy transducer TonB [Methylococcales bacterium]